MNRHRLITAGILLGIGMGGFVDGIVFHQILQFHSMLSAKLPQDVLVNVKASMVWDGVFHLFTWLVTAAGLAVLFFAGKDRNCPWPGKTLWGSMLSGWGLFNFTEGLIDHHLFGVHHVVEREGLSQYDYIFLASGIVLMVIGWALVRSARTDTGTSARTPFTVYK